MTPNTLTPNTATPESHTLLQAPSGKLNLVLAVWMLAFHALAIAAFFYFRWSSLLVFAILWVLAQNIGIGMSYHRQLTHRGYLTPRWLEYNHGPLRHPRP